MRLFSRWFVKRSLYRSLLATHRRVAKELSELKHALHEEEEKRKQLEQESLNPSKYIQSQFFGNKGIESFDYRELVGDERETFLRAIYIFYNSTAWKKEKGHLLLNLSKTLITDDTNLSKEDQNMIKKLIVYVESLDERWGSIAVEYESKKEHIRQKTTVHSDRKHDTRVPPIQPVLSIK